MASNRGERSSVRFWPIMIFGLIFLVFWPVLIQWAYFR